MEKSLFDIKMGVSTSIISFKNKLFKDEMTTAILKGKILNCKQNNCESHKEYLGTECI